MDETIIKRVMPNSLEAEQSVIGSMIMDKDAIVTAMEMLLREDFYHQQYGVLFETMVELYSDGQPVDLVTLQNKLKEKDVPREVSSLEFVRDLVTAVPTSANIKYYATIVKENSVKRKLIHVTEGIEIVYAKDMTTVLGQKKRCLVFFPAGQAENMCPFVRW